MSFGRSADHENAIGRCAVMSSRGENLPACASDQKGKDQKSLRGDYYEKDRVEKPGACVSDGSDMRLCLRGTENVDGL